MLPVAEAGHRGDLLHGEVTESFDSTGGNELGVLRRRAAPGCWVNPLIGC